MIDIHIEPHVLPNGSSVLIFVIQGSIDANTTFAFDFISPFRVSGLGNIGNNGNWSYRNVKTLGSAVFYIYRLPPNLKGGFVQGNAIIYFSNLAERQDHGEFTVFLPFGGAITPEFSTALNLSQPFTLSSGLNFDMLFDIPLVYRVTSSYPSFTSTYPYLNYASGNSFQSLRYRLNDTTSVSIGYENTPLVDYYSTQ